MSKPRPFEIRIFVAEGIPDGLRFVEKSNWVGLGIICPRGRYPQVKKRQEFSGSGVYILVGRDGDDDRPTLYIGEAETVRARLDSHHANKDFWQTAIVFTTKGDPLNKAEVQYLEARLVELAAENKRCGLENANTPNRPTLSEADEFVIEGYLDELLSLLPVLGINAFEPAQATSTKHRHYLWSGKGWKATGYETSSGFAVRAGSLARRTTVPSMKVQVPSSYNKRKQLIADKVLVKEAAGYRFAIPHEFSSPSQAAAVCAGRSANGRVDWKDAKGTTLKEHQQQEAKA
jgi:Domain of unknown function (DUF4357)